MLVGHFHFLLIKLSIEGGFQFAAGVIHIFYLHFPYVFFFFLALKKKGHLTTEDDSKEQHMFTGLFFSSPEHVLFFF